MTNHAISRFLFSLSGRFSNELASVC